MRLYACPMCGQEPTVVQWGDMWGAFCWCMGSSSFVRADGPDALRHRWNDLYCANDPATAEDCE